MVKILNLVGAKLRQSFITNIYKNGAFLEASKIISKHNGNIVRASFNKAVDMHTFFIDVTGEKKDLEEIAKELKLQGYCSNLNDTKSTVLISIGLENKSGSLKEVLEIINQHEVEIPYMNFQQEDKEMQQFVLGIFVDNDKEMRDLFFHLSKICYLKIVDYDLTNKVLDNAAFYLDFGNKIMDMFDLTENERKEFLINSNIIMQQLDAENENPYKTFRYILKFAEFLKNHMGKNFECNIYKKELAENVSAYQIEPPCGSNTFILKQGNQLLIVDGGYSNFKADLISDIKKLIPKFDDMNKKFFITHADIDHTGIASEFDEVYMSDKSYQNFENEKMGKPCFREKIDHHAPYNKLCKLITEYKAPKLENCKIIGNKKDKKMLSKIGKLKFGDFTFEAMEGNGGHIYGETILYCEKLGILFSGDNYVNIKGFSDKQKEYNSIAPYLMRSVNIDSKKANSIRKEIKNKFKGYFVCPGHGSWLQF